MAKKRHHHSSYSRQDRKHDAGAMRHPMSDPLPNSTNRGYKAHNAGMISEDRHAPALLPQHVIEKYWPVAHNYHMGMVDDLFDGVQRQLHQDYNDLGREMSPKKY